MECHNFYLISLLFNSNWEFFTIFLFSLSAASSFNANLPREHINIDINKRQRRPRGRDDGQEIIVHFLLSETAAERLERCDGW